MNYLITGKNFAGKMHLKTSSGFDIEIISGEKLIQSDVNFSKKDKIYCSAESSLASVLEKISPDDQELVQQIEVFKDKVKFRKLLQKLIPDFYFQEVKLSDLKDINLKPDKKYVVKPSKGFFSTGVEFIDSNSDLEKVVLKIKDDLSEKVKLFSESVLSKEELIIEEFIPGDEYAADFYYDSQGEPVIMNIYHHPEHDNFEYMHALYYTNHKIFSEFKEKLEIFLRELNKDLKIKSMPIHPEFKYHNGQIIPVEFNPVRYGGYGLSDLAYYAFGFNPLESFYKEFKPDWDKVWSSRQEYNYGWILAYNGVDLDLEEYCPEQNGFKKKFKNIMAYYDLDYKKEPAFGITYIKDKNIEELLKVLKFEFKDFFKKN